MFKKLFVSSTSACFEFENTDPYYSPVSYKVYLNGERVVDDCTTNVFRCST